jgi:hypothetical protein
MNPELDAILSADEESRAQLEQAQATAKRRLTAARTDRERRRQERLATAMRELEQEERHILEQADHEVAERQRRRAVYLETRRLATAKASSQGVDTYVRIVRDGPPPGAKR